MCKSEITRVYFSHDQDARGDDKIKEMFFDFRKAVKDIDLSELKALASISCYSIYWSIVEYMHRNAFCEKDVELMADDLRISPEFVQKVLNNYGLFHKNGGEYISDRVIANLSKQKEKSETRRRAVQVRWTMSFYNKAYKAEFGMSPVLSDEEIDNLIKYSNEIEDFKKILPDILYTLKFIQVSKDMKFNPRSNWLLTKNNLAKVLHGEFGKLRHKKTAKELKAEQERLRAEQEQLKADEFDINQFDSKSDALSFIVQHTPTLNILPPYVKTLMKKFDITKKEIEKEKT